MTDCPWTFRGILMIDQYHISFMGGDRHRIKELHDEQFNDVFRSWGIKVKKSVCSRISGINPHRNRINVLCED